MKAPLISCAIRTGLVASTVAVALAIPQFAYVTALGGALFGLTVCVCIPAAAFLKITRGYASGAAACSFTTFGCAHLVALCLTVMPAEMTPCMLQEDW